MDQKTLKYTSINRMGAVAVLRPKQRLVGDDETDEFRDVVGDLNTEKMHCLVINLADIDFINSPGLTALFDAHQRFAKRGAHVHLTQLDKRIQNLLVITKLSLVFDVYPTEEAAIAGCVGKAAPEVR